MVKVFSFLQPTDLVPKHIRQLVYIANILSLILSALTFSILIILLQLFGWLPSHKYILIIVCIFIAVPIINKKYWDIGRLLFCLTPVWLTMFTTLYGKSLGNALSYISYFDSRYILLATAILPAIVFKLSERSKISVCLLSTIICLLFYDPIHSAFGLGYYQLGYTNPSYHYINYIVLAAFFVLLFGIIVLKSITEKAEERATLFIEEKETINQKLLDQNVQLTRLNADSEAQNEELQQQQEELSASREMLQEANELISKQQKKLIDYNAHLEALVDEKNKNLIQANDELVKHNNELRQFSYTVSHNLRGPVARLLGLSNIVKGSMDATEQKIILDYISQSAIDLDSVLKDLSHIIDIRNELYNVREKVMLEDEWMKATTILGENIKSEFSLITNFQKAPFVFSIRAMLQSILFNLLSNAIKYRAPDRSLVVEVHSYSNALNEIVLEIKDNGLGIDLDTQKENVFKLYKRFHTHVTGKGLGLFLVKTQVEALNGKIELESKLNVGTVFRITFPTPPAVDKQIFFESETAQLFYDANLNNTVLVWKRSVTSQEYRSAFESLLQTLKTYNTPGWIADLRLQGKVPDEDQIWFLTYVLPEAVRHGLKRISAIGFNDPIREAYYKRMIEKVAEFNIVLQVFESYEEARHWMQSFLHDSTLKS